MEVTGATYDPNKSIRFTLYLPDGTPISKQEISILLTSKFRAKPFRTNQYRKLKLDRTDIEKTTRQYNKDITIVPYIKIISIFKLPFIILIPFLL